MEKPTRHKFDSIGGTAVNFRSGEFNVRADSRGVNISGECKIECAEDMSIVASMIGKACQDWEELKDAERLKLSGDAV